MSRIVLLFGLLWAVIIPAAASDLDDARLLYRSGKYAEAEEFAAQQVEAGIWNERWPRLLIDCQMARGKYTEATKTYEDAIRRYPTSLTLRMQGMQALRYASKSDQAADAKNQIMLLLQSSPSRYASRDNLVAAGRFFTMRGEDARKILEAFYDRVRDADPEHAEAYIATAELALEKGDYKVAADTLAAAQRFDQTDPRIPYMMARAWESSDPEKANAAINAAFEMNPNHVPSLIYRADAAIDRELYIEAEELLRRVLSINVHQQQAWALKAVLAHLKGQFEYEVLFRAAALSTWSENPAVDHLIGKKLSQKYRFEEGAEYQRKALELDPKYVQARFQLAQDLLRLGNEDVGWEVARLAAEQDEYNVVASNLLTLRERIKGFSVLEADGIQVRMDSMEASIYGPAVIELLSEAKKTLCEKYGVEPRKPIVVEIFPEQKDFAIRTFGLPGGAGFLGVCFGRVITANSPASQGERPSNWQSVLWHEFCHVVTLEKTKNRMPRWLSEGISVYEERQRNAAWGESISPVYREMLLDDALTPVTKLSSAFLNPPSPIHLQFAYFQSSLVIEFLVQKHGLDAVKGILSDLGNGLIINDAMARNIGSLERLDSEFVEFARQHASEFGSKADWSRDGVPDEPRLDDWELWVQEHPNSYWGLRATAEAYFVEGQFEKSKVALEKLKELGTLTGERGGPLELLAQVYQKLDDSKAERRVLAEHVAKSSDALPSLRRLIELSTKDENWEAVRKYAADVIAINPMLAEGQTALAQSAEQQGEFADAAGALRALARMGPVDPASIDFRMARALQRTGSLQESRHHVLRALLEAPRYREAHDLLLELNDRIELSQQNQESEGSSQNAVDEDETGELNLGGGNKPAVENSDQPVGETSDDPGELSVGKAEGTAEEISSDGDLNEGKPE
ncbi:tetratricopeptide repeat protein [bacterium]|nr:tetratricopeptide repeat protein [bacterium]